jgi:hypothetical protein
MKNLPTWAAAVALAAAVSTTTSAFGQADLQAKAAADAEARQKQEQKHETQTERAERQREKREREELSKMPNPVKKVLKAETQNATNIDYFKTKGENGQKPTFGATFTRNDGHNFDIHVDRDGNILSRTDLTAQAQATAAPATPAPATPAPATPGAPTAGTAQAPASSNTTARRLQATEVPANVRTVLDREAQGGKDVKYYRSKYGSEAAYTVDYDDTNGRGHRVFVDDNGKILARHDDTANQSQTASSTEKAGSSSSTAPGRVELTAIPKQAQTQLRRLTEGGTDVKFYRTKYGSEQAYQANYTTKDGKEHRVYVDDNGKILSQKDENEKK